MEHLDHPSPISMMSKWRVFCNFDFMVSRADSTWRDKSWRRQALVLAQALLCICLKVFKNRLYYLRHVRVCLLNHVYIHSFRSIKEATEKVSLGWGHLITWNGPVMGHLNSFSASGGGIWTKIFQKFKCPGVAIGGMFKLRFDGYIIRPEPYSTPLE